MFLECNPGLGNLKECVNSVLRSEGHWGYDPGDTPEHGTSWQAPGG